MPKYTFLLPAYKGQFLREALESILSQTYTDFSVLVSDDCSPEDLKSIVDEFAYDPRVIYRRNAENMGGKSLVAHWNLLVDMCDTEWLILAPDDDLWHPRFLEEMDFLEQKFPQVDVIKTRVQKIDNAGDVIEQDRIYEDCISQIDNIFHQVLPDHMSGIGNYVFRTSALKAMGGFVDYPLAWWSDVMTNIQLSKNGMPVTCDILFSMRMSGLNISMRKPSIEEGRNKLFASLKYWDDMNLIINKLQIKSKKDEWMLNEWRWSTRAFMTQLIIKSVKLLKFHEVWCVYNKRKDLIRTHILVFRLFSSYIKIF